MSKVLVEIYIPAASKSFDMLIPNHLILCEALTLINKLAIEVSDGLFVPTDDTVISNRETGAILNVNLSVSELDIKNGTKLMLI